ncbi:MAG: hypothetical protein IJP81_06635 [Bacteroidales bacterium]|nr:hypothetical protein [Bacteroidales bacterium]
MKSPFLAILHGALLQGGGRMDNPQTKEGKGKVHAAQVVGNAYLCTG